jgi:5'-3' exonuclease
LESIKGVGFKKAVKLVQTYGDDIKSITQELKKTNSNIDIESYIEEFSRAYLTFKH